MFYEKVSRRTWLILYTIQYIRVLYSNVKKEMPIQFYTGYRIFDILQTCFIANIVDIRMLCLQSSVTRKVDDTGKMIYRVHPVRLDEEQKQWFLGGDVLL